MTTAALACTQVWLDLGGARVVDGVTLRFASGSWTAIVGPNGAGKSSLLTLLAGLRRAGGGSVQLAGRALDAWPAQERARRLGWLSQYGEADGDIAVRDVVGLGRLPHTGLFGAAGAGDAAAIAAAMAEADVAALAGRRLSELSGGERQRVLIARVLAVGAPVMLLDEPTTHLDAPHQRALVAALAARARRGHTIVSVLHDLTLALAADRVVVMAAGRVCADGAVADDAVRRTIVAVFGDAFTIEAVPREGGTRWVALPRLDDAESRA